MSNFSQSNCLATQNLTPALAAFGTDLREQHIKALITQSRSKVNYNDQNSWGTPAVFSSAIQSDPACLCSWNRILGMQKQTCVLPEMTELDFVDWSNLSQSWTSTLGMQKQTCVRIGDGRNIDIIIIIIDWSNLSHWWKGRKYRKQRGRPSDSSALVLFVCLFVVVAIPRGPGFCSFTVADY